MEKFKVVITGGGTREYIDDVRVLTNISSGKLSKIACEYFKTVGADVVYIHSRGAMLPHGNVECVEAVTVSDLLEATKKYVPEAALIIHAMAVSDFTFDRSVPIKLKSNDAEGFIEYMRKTIRKTPKVISFLRGLNKEAFLVGFKFEVGIDREDLFKIARESKLKNDLNLVVANDLQEIKSRKEHIAYLISDDREIQKAGKFEIAKGIFQEFRRNI